MTNPANLLQQAGDRAKGGDPAGARTILNQLIDLANTSVELLLPAAFMAFQLGDPALAERSLRRAIEINPEFAPAHTNLGNILREQGRLDDAITATEAACRLAPRDPMNHVNLAILFEMTQRPDRAEPALRAALEQTPGEPGLLDALGRVLLKLARPAEAMTALRQAIQKAPRLASAHFNMANIYQQAEQLDQAAGSYKTVLDLEPVHLAAQANLALVHLRQDRLDEAEAGFRLITEKAPDDPAAFNNLSQTRYQQGAFQAAVSACDGALAADPGNRAALANKIIILNEMADKAGADYLQNFAAFVTADLIAAPPGYDSIAAFNDALFREVEAEPDRFSEQGQGQARQTRDIMLTPGPAVGTYGEVIEAAVRRYIANLPNDPGHPFMASTPSAWRLEAWGTISREIAQGEDTHIHPDAWLSGVYYARLPAAVRDDRDTGGYLEIGRAPNHMAQTQAPELKIIRPEAGLLVLFPSYIHHRIMPFQADDIRMSVAFDAVPS